TPGPPPRVQSFEEPPSYRRPSRRRFRRVHSTLNGSPYSRSSSYRFRPHRGRQRSRRRPSLHVVEPARPARHPHRSGRSKARRAGRRAAGCGALPAARSTPPPTQEVAAARSSGTRRAPTLRPWSKTDCASEAVPGGGVPVASGPGDEQVPDASR
ncbi:hypothetical protein V5799_003813, partial [Amblyomma americanum]